MKSVSIALLIFLSCVNLYAQSVDKTEQSKYSVLDGNGCLRPEAESQTYGFWRGKIVKVLSANKVTFALISKKFTVKLVGIDPSQNKDEVIKFLRENVLNQEIYIRANLRKQSDRKFMGVISLVEDKKNIGDINDYLVEKGIAKFKDFNTAYLVPDYVPCRLENAEKRAKSAKLGIWAK